MNLLGIHFLTTVGSSLESFASLLLGQALEALPLLLIALVVGRTVRHGAIVHLLWLLVLIKLLIPPVHRVPVEFDRLAGSGIEIPVPPIPPKAPSVLSIEDPRAGVALVSDLAPASESVFSFLQPVFESWSPLSWLGLIFAAGSVVWVFQSLRRIRDFRRELQDAGAPDSDVILRLHALAERMGLDSVPRTRVMDARFSPMVWTRWQGAELLLPSSLLRQLGKAELDAVLAHELAHLKRRDHWVRMIELMVVASFWWHPLLSLARRELHRAEERACDVWVQRLLPGSGRSYAGALLKTLDFLKPSQKHSPALACAIQPKNDWKERLTMIVTEKTARPLRAWQRGGLALLAALLLSVVPTLAGPEDVGEETRPGVETAKAQEDLEASREAFERQREAFDRQREAIERQHQDLEARRLDLEEQMIELEQREIELAVRRQESDREVRTKLLETQALQLETEGLREEAAAMREELVRAREQSRLEERHLEIERRHLGKRREAELALRRARLQARELRIAGKDQEADKLEGKLEKRALEIERMAQAEHKERIALEKVRIDQESRQMQIEVEQLRRSGNEEAADQLQQALTDLLEVKATLSAQEIELQSENEP